MLLSGVYRLKVGFGGDIPSHLVLLLRKAALFVKGDVLGRTVEDHLVAACLGSNIFEGLNDAQTEFLALLVAIDSDILNMAHQTIVMHKLAFDKNSANSDNAVL